MNINKYKEYLIEKRRHFHRYPEIGFDVSNTIKYIQDELLSFGFITYIEDSGLVGVLKNDDGHVIALRSDVDALAVPDLTNNSYSSVYENRNHACGHDAHMAMLLGTCKYISENKDFYKGTLKVIFQAAEEGPLPGGASSLSKSIHLKDVESFFALHVMTDFPTNKIVCKQGPFMAAVDIINIKIHGKSTHVANPHLGLNPIDVVPELVTQLKNIVQEKQNLLGITQIVCGETHNVIPDLCTIRGSLRTLDEQFRIEVKKKIKHICNIIAKENNIIIDLNIEDGYPSVNNDPSLFVTYKEMITKNFGEESFLELKKPSLLAEDFSYYQLQSKGLMAYLGSKSENKKIIYPNHHYKFDIDEDVLLTGMKIHLLTIKNYLN